MIRRPLAGIAASAALLALAASAASLAACVGPTGRSAAALPVPSGPATSTTPAPSLSADSPSPAIGTPTAAPPAKQSTAVIPPGVTAGIAVFDRRTGSFTEQHNITMRFRSASLVKLLIALDYLWNLGPEYAVPAADRGQLDLMLRSSDDDAASYFYRRNGSGAVVTRMVSRLGLQNTTPPSGGRTGWGSTALSAADVVRVYRYILDTAPVPMRDYIMGNLRQSTRCGTDGFDQSYGIPATFNKPWAAKQGWYEFAGTPPGAGCTKTTAAADTGVDLPVAATGPARAELSALGSPPGPDGVDWTGEVLHTTGVVGAGDRSIIVVLTLHRHGTPFATASAAVTRLTGTLRSVA